MQIARHTVASIDYTLTDNDGQVLDTSEGREPLTYIHGEGNLIPGLETALEGQNPGDSLSVTIEPAEAYGERDERLIQQVPMAAFEGVESVEPGMRFQATDEQGQGRVVTVTEVEGDEVTVDANHPLAGQPLNFEVSVVEVREATPEEIDHGHVHTGEDDH
jgi:FKBP-type peptidyl-prolyl cis-trans isomerase SlyD